MYMEKFTFVFIGITTMLKLGGWISSIHAAPAADVSPLKTSQPMISQLFGFY